MADFLPGTTTTQAFLDAALAKAPAPFPTWYLFLLDWQPQGLAEVPVWYVTLVEDQVKAGHITGDEARQLLTADLASQPAAEPVSMIGAWDSLMGLIVRTWPKRRKRAAKAVLDMNTSVTQAVRRLSHG